ncbi:MAG: glycosyl hydrolase-related protein [Chloroflexi bacterium]|nr:glycosyl hydrolase-related protein [Chloroflexota bacterium]
MTKIHLVAHTHWDREWYLTYQMFRLKLVSLIDKLLDILANDPEFLYFMLDGQTIVLDDYLQVRPSRAAELEEFIRQGRIMIGPWYILPDEFLVSPESIIRNLLQGSRMTSQYGVRMNVGYVPDPFGHIAQMPQILRGFGIESASVERGLSDEPCEFWWQAPDGSQVLMAYLRDGYGNAANLSFNDPEMLFDQVCQRRDALLPHSLTGQLLFMNGTDHTEPDAAMPQALFALNQRLEQDQVVQSTLPEFIASLRTEIETRSPALPIVRGELRDPKRFHLLPGVLSTRMWIKQRNHACETLLEKWAEPSIVMAGLAISNRPPEWKDKAISSLAGWIRQPGEILQEAWKLLLQCQPHDSICGCSIDQVHEEMKSRFDQVEQIGEEITRQNLALTSALIETQKSAPQGALGSIVVFNPHPFRSTDIVRVTIQQDLGHAGVILVTEKGEELPYQITSTSRMDVANFTGSRDELEAVLPVFLSGRYGDTVVQDVSLRVNNKVLAVDAIMKNNGQPNEAAIQKGLTELSELMKEKSFDQISIHAYTSETKEISFLAKDVPGLGYRTIWMQPTQKPATVLKPPSTTGRIENEYFTVDVDPYNGTVSIYDHRTGQRYFGLNRFVDGGDCGDEYNYCPPQEDQFYTPRVEEVQTSQEDGRQTLRIKLVMDVSSGLAPQRIRRSQEIVTQEILTTISLFNGVARVDIHTEVENRAQDHRLRVHFPAPFSAGTARYDSHFDIIERPTAAPTIDAAWVEQPRPEKPQRLFVDLSTPQAGLMIANRGLPEVEVVTLPEEASEIALTLLRCVGWLSRSDLTNRKGDAGPSLETPGAQMPGRWGFDYAILPHTGDWEAVLPLAYSFNSPMRAVPDILHDGFLLHEATFFAIEPSSFIVTSLKPSEDQLGWVLRGYNALAERRTYTIGTLFSYQRAFRTRLDETIQNPLTKEKDGKISIELRSHEIATIKFVE